MSDQFQFTGDPQFFSEVEDFRQEIYELHDRQLDFSIEDESQETEPLDERPEELLRTLPQY